MDRLRKHKLAQWVVLLAALMFLLPLNAVTVKAADKVTTKIEHESLDYFVPEKRIQLTAEVADPNGVNLVRCYFRAAGQADFVFVPMTSEAANTYTGIIPAPSAQTEMIEYLFLAVNGANQVVKTYTFTVKRQADKEAPAWQQVSGEGDITVSTELAEAPEAIQGFTDSITIDVVESSARFGMVVGGIYLITQIENSGGATGTAAAATSAGTISAAAGLSTAAMVAIGVGAAAAAGGGIALASSDSGGGSSHHDDSSNGGSNGGGGTDIPQTVTGTWEMHFRCASQITDAAVFNINLNESSGGAFSGTGTGTDYTGEGLTMDITGNYNSNTNFISGEVTTTFDVDDCVRKDTFSTTLNSNDSGYIPMTQTQECGCDAEIRMVKID